MQIVKHITPEIARAVLNISAGETLPVEFLSLRNVVYGGSGAGKTAFGRVIFEESIKAGIPCGVIDLKADWWGLKSSADGKSDGIPVVIFGGDHADVPIHENGGAELAEIVAELRQPFIVDLENFSKGKQLKFMAPFFDRLYDKNRHPLKLICDESDRYIPQRILTKDPNAAICLGAGEDIAKRGRKHGIFAMFISQRNADLNKSVTELCDVATVFRTSGPNDQKAVADWFRAKGGVVTEAQRAQVMREIAGLANGEAFFCSAHPHLPMFKKVRLRMPATFDSSATPEIGKELLQPKKFARIELDQIGERMRATIEQAKANDPAVLKRALANAEKDADLARSISEHLGFGRDIKDWRKVTLKLDELVAHRDARPTDKEVIKEVPVLTDEEKKLLGRGIEACEKVLESFAKLQSETAESIADMQRFFEPIRAKLSTLNRQTLNPQPPTANPQPPTLNFCGTAITGGRATTCLFDC